jgi:hypothetical protein
MIYSDIYMLYEYYIHDIYQVYTVHIHGIFQAYAHVTNMPGIYPLQTSWVCSVPFFNNYILVIC